MKIYHTFIILTIIVISVMSCAKSASLNLDTTPVNSDTSFQPATAGSFWVYYTTDINGVLKDSFTVSSTGRDTSINSKQYVVFNYDTSQQYQYNSGNQYAFRFTSYNFNTSYGLITLKGLNVIYINNSTDPVGTQWNFSCIDGDYVTVPMAPVPVQTRAVGIVRGTGLQVTDSLNNVTYKNVFYSHINYQVNYLNSWTTVGAMDIYAAKSVGILVIKTYGQNGQLSSTQTLNRCQID